MRLRKGILHNFGSFADAVIDLSDISAGVVTGPNGAGKSTAVVDSVLWCLFGECRAPMDSMMRIGADEMSVEWEWEINQQRYRANRKRSLKTKRGSSQLSVSLANGSAWTPVAVGVDPGQKKIFELLNADYQLLISTGFLLQGQADRFSRATSSERKAILAQILRLDQYGPLKQAATRHLTIADAKQGEKSGQLVALDEEASTVESLEARQGQVQTALIESNKAIEQLEQHQQELTNKKAGAAADLEQLKAIPGQIEALRTQQSALLKDQAAKTARRERAAKILSNRSVIEGKVTDEASVRLRQTHLEGEAKDLQADVDAVTTQLEHANKELLIGARLKASVDQATQRLDRLVSTYQMETRALKEEIGRDEQQTALLTQVPCGADLQKVCRFTLTATTIKAALPDKVQRCAARRSTEGEIMEEVYPIELEAVKDAQEAWAAWAAKEWETVITRLATRKTALLTTQKSVKQQLETIKLALIELAKFTVLVPELDSAEREVVSVDEDLTLLAEQLARLDQDLDRLKARQADRATLTDEYERLANEWQQDAIYLQRLRTDGQTAIGRLKELELEIKRAQDAGRQAEQLRQECESLRIDGRHFQALATAYTQIPVLILESSIPLLEEEANRILGKISSSGLRVTFDTQKALKSRDGLAETLDITVRDVFGERMLENYSGGERARVDLAIRIGLSRLLANRAGARLETLVVDEAFAAVDREGVEQLVECLPMLSQEFSLILFITHDESFKSSIAQQILVTKGPSGSQVAVVA